MNAGTRFADISIRRNWPCHLLSKLTRIIILMDPCNLIKCHDCPFNLFYDDNIIDISDILARQLLRPKTLMICGQEGDSCIIHKSITYFIAQHMCNFTYEWSNKGKVNDALNELFVGNRMVSFLG